MSAESVATIIVSIGLSTLVTWFLGPRETIRQDTARRNLELRRRIRRILEQLQRHLRNEELRRRRLEEGGQATMLKLTIRDYEKLLWPAVRALEEPDLGQRLAQKLRNGLRDLLGSWRLEYLSICETENLENALDRYPVQPLEARHIEEPEALLPALFSRMGESAPATKAIARVQKLIEVLG